MDEELRFFVADRKIRTERVEPRGVHYLFGLLLNNYAQCVDIAVKYFANVNIGEQHCGNFGSLTHCSLYMSINSIQAVPQVVLFSSLRSRADKRSICPTEL